VIENPKRRWTVGHQLFFVVIQGVIMGLDELTRAIERHDTASIRRSLADTTSLMHLSATAMQYTGDFSKEAYESVVRPSMPETFSGLDNLDHAWLMKFMSVMKRSSAAVLERDFAVEFAAFRQSINDAYDAHIWVCERFVGGKASLRTSSSEMSATEVLEKFKAKRLALIAERR
jgi:hypothetical protein